MPDPLSFSTQATRSAALFMLLWGCVFQSGSFRQSELIKHSETDGWLYQSASPAFCCEVFSEAWKCYPPGPHTFEQINFREMKWMSSHSQIVISSRLILYSWVYWEYVVFLLLVFTMLSQISSINIYTRNYSPLINYLISRKKQIVQNNLAMSQ